MNAKIIKTNSVFLYFDKKMDQFNLIIYGLLIAQ